MQVCFHKFEDQVQIFVIIGFKHIMKLNYILMLELVEEHNFAIGPLCICGVLEGIEYFFQGQRFGCFFISYFPHVAVCSASYLLDKLVSVKDVRLNLISHCIKRVFEFQIFKPNVKLNLFLNIVALISRLKMNFKGNFSFEFLQSYQKEQILVIKPEIPITMESQSIAQKQQYLRENIIDAGYDAEDFVQYCTKEHNLADLADWPMQKLMQVVQLYISIKRTQNSRPYNPNNDDDDWTNFEEAPAPLNDNQKIQLKNQAESHHNSTKTGQLVFSEADWGIFLGQNTSGSHSSTAKHAFEPEKKSETKGSNNKNKQSLNTIGLSEKQAQKLKQTSKKVQITGQGAFENIGKQNPLSPPSQNIKKQLSNISGLIEQGSLKRQNRGPINFTNVKLTTSKTKAMPKLPQINDITITKTQQVSRNFLQSDYTLYHIHFAPGNHTIQRKFTDFRKLRGILQNMYPHVRLPYLEPEGWLTSSQGKDTQTLAKYKWMILDFLKYIVMRNNQLKNCPLVRKFCGYSTSAKSQKQYQDVSKQDLKKVFQFYQNLPRAKTIGQICLSNNFVILPPSSDGQKLISSTVNLMQQIDHEYEKLKKKFDVLFYNYDLLAKSLSDVSSSFQTLQNLIKKYNGENDQPKEFRIYEGLKEICIKMHNSMNQQFVVFKVRMKNILRYQKDNMMTLKQLFDCKNKIHYEYAKQGYPSLSKGSQSGCGEIQIESNISLQEPCKSNKNTLCVQQIFWSHFTKQEIKCYWQQLRKKINEQLTMISYEQLDNENENLNFWNSMIKKCVV